MRVRDEMSDSTERPLAAIFTALLLGLVLATAVGWATLILGGHTDNAGRMGILLGAVVFVLVSTGWRRGRRGWLQGLAGAAVLGAAMGAHFWMGLGR